MDTKIAFRLLLAANVFAAFAGGASQTSQEEDTLSKRLVKMSESEQIVWLNNYISEGAPASDAVGSLVMSKPSLFLPILEQKIEEILHSPAPKDLFRDRAVDPQRVVYLAVSMIEYAGSELALREASKLIKVDEHLFGNMVSRTLWESRNQQNPFKLVYQGFEINDPTVDTRIIAWIREIFGYKDEPDRVRTMTSWAEAMVERYNGAPTAVQWTNDPIVSRLGQAEQDSLRNEMPRFTAEAEQKRTKK